MGQNEDWTLRRVSPPLCPATPPSVLQLREEDSARAAAAAREAPHVAGASEDVAADLLPGQLPQQ
eukprot:7767821-Alexandrium_andersonii.AAC.1